MWELQCSHKRSVISRQVEKTFFDLTKQKAFDEMLYGLYARKLQLLTDNEAQKIIYLKIEYLKSIRVFAVPKGKEDKELMQKNERFRILEDFSEKSEGSDGEQYPYYEIGCADVTIYLLLKKPSISDVEKYKSIVTLCLLVASYVRR